MKFIEENYQSEILNIKHSIPLIIDSLSRLPSMNEVENIKDKQAKLSKLLFLLKKSKDSLSERQLMFASLLLGEYIREANNGKWILLETHSLSWKETYFTPSIIYPDSCIFSLFASLRTYFENREILPQVYSQLPFVKNPKLKLGNPFFNAHYLSYKIID